MHKRMLVFAFALIAMKMKWTDGRLFLIKSVAVKGMITAGERVEVARGKSKRYYTLVLIVGGECHCRGKLGKTTLKTLKVKTVYSTEVLPPAPAGDQGNGSQRKL